MIDLFRNFTNCIAPALRMKVLVLHKNSGIEIRGESLQCLKLCAWLNDDVVVILFSHFSYVFLNSFVALIYGVSVCSFYRS